MLSACLMRACQGRCVRISFRHGSSPLLVLVSLALSQDAMFLLVVREIGHQLGTSQPHPQGHFIFVWWPGGYRNVQPLCCVFGTGPHRVTNRGISGPLKPCLAPVQTAVENPPFHLHIRPGDIFHIWLSPPFAYFNYVIYGVPKVLLFFFFHEGLLGVRIFFFSISPFIYLLGEDNVLCWGISTKESFT